MSAATSVSYARHLGLFSATMAVVGGIIGSGIFLNPAIVAARVGTPGLAVGAWVMGGVIALLGAFCFAELGQRLPRAGGGYVYIRDAFGPLPAFLYGWTLLLVISTGAIAAVAVTFARYAVALLGLPGHLSPGVAAAAIAVLTAVNYLGVRPGALTQNVFTVLKLAALGALIVAGLAVGRSVSPEVSAGVAAPSGAVGVAVAMGAALVPVLFAYGGWQQTNFIAEELVDVERNLPRALLFGTGIVVVVYVLANIAYLRVLGIHGLLGSEAPAADVLASAAGRMGERLIGAGIAASTFGFTNLVILVTPRVYQAMAADGVFFPRLAGLHPRFRTPSAALLLQGGWAVVLTLSGTYSQLLDYVVFGDWIFFGLAAATVFVFRARERAGGAPAANGFRAPLYPLTPALFVLAAGYVMASSVRGNPGNAAIGAALVLSGIPVYHYWSRRRLA